MDTSVISTSTWLIIAALGSLNFLAFVLVGIDKSRSAHDHRRVPEMYFFLWAIFFSSLGVLLGMLIWHHKTRKLSFTVGMSALLLQQIALLDLCFISKFFV